MCSFSNYMESNILNHIFGKSNYCLSNIYVGLLSVEPNENGTSVSEPDCPSYTRVETNASSWDQALEGMIRNVENITFSIACENWGTVTHFALFDAFSRGNILAYGKLSPSITICSGNTPRFAPGDLMISLD
jgi:hypothetical protein